MSTGAPQRAQRAQGDGGLSTVRAAAPTVGVLLAGAAERLAAAGLPTARPDAEWLLAAVLGAERLHIVLDRARVVAAPAAARFEQLVARRAAHEPLQHLLGYEDFHGVRLRVTPDVLVPRPETEALVAWALEVLASWPRPRIADVGTGSGAIACALANARPDAEVVAIDSSLAALEVARDNARRLGLARRVRVLAGDLLAPLAPRPAGGGLDLVIANLPYLPTGLLPSLPREVVAYEPRLALDGGGDGLRLVRRLVAEAPRVLRPGGAVLVEVGEDQAGAVASLLAAEGFVDVAARRDLAGVERHLGARRPTADAAARSSRSPGEGPAGIAAPARYR